MKRERFSSSKTIQLSEKMAEDVQAVADMLDASFADVIRECIRRELPKLKDRERKRKKSRKA